MQTQIKIEVVHTIQEVKERIQLWKRNGEQIGFVPTMGYLHEGHESLIQAAKRENDHVVVSIFVNPMQFGPKEDLQSYPRDLEKDTILCQKNGVDLIFHPTPEEMYGASFSTYVDMTGLTEGLCGKSRPVHFRGVQTVVLKLFHIVEADRAYFGQKDAQQLAVIKKMVRELNCNVKIVSCPIIREEDGLAKSSRNTYLSEKERRAALILSQSLKQAKQKIQMGERSTKRIRQEIIDCINTEPLATIDYVELVTWDTLVQTYNIESSLLIAIAVYIGKTRLIDNFIWNEKNQRKVE